MKQDRLLALSLIQLKQKKRTYTGLLLVLSVLILSLFALTFYMSLKSGPTPMLAVPFALIPLLINGFRKLKAIEKEIEFRAVSSAKLELG
ncbi:hypothetical protein EO244_11755 [Ancylomarina salipaludis]|uniref:Redox-active disulfide protein 2 n=1 Tax=Ancylomarina salipaludis TaxID=2501299 RepID=A0A4V1MZZ5_9BACT|nr:hypothetical protein [Ancylomarina salipaludis]RXQ92217.1 hypothetical protein EO244_11755 [Ancylomarina salipaludis]